MSELEPLSAQEMDAVGDQMRSLQHLNPDVTLVMPAHLEERGIGHAMRAILPSMQAARYKCECIVVANATEDDHTAEYAQRCGAKIVTEPKKGLTFARQAGIDFSRGRIIIQHDGDVRNVPDQHINRHMLGYEDGDVVGVAGTVGFDHVSPVYVVAYEMPRKIFRALMECKHKQTHQKPLPFVSGANLSYRKSTVDTFGGYGDFLTSQNGEDFLMGTRLMEKGELLNDTSDDNHVLSDGRRFANAWRVGNELRKKTWLGIRRLKNPSSFPLDEQFKDIR